MRLLLLQELPGQGYIEGVAIMSFIGLGVWFLKWFVKWVTEDYKATMMANIESGTKVTQAVIELKTRIIELKDEVADLKGLLNKP